MKLSCSLWINIVILILILCPFLRRQPMPASPTIFSTWETSSYSFYYLLRDSYYYCLYYQQIGLSSYILSYTRPFSSKCILATDKAAAILVVHSLSIPCQRYGLCKFLYYLLFVWLLIIIIVIVDWFHFSLSIIFTRRPLLSPGTCLPRGLRQVAHLLHIRDAFSAGGVTIV
jgi:hypothetical protein